MTGVRWDLSSIYPGLASPEFVAAFAALQSQCAAMEQLFDSELASTNAGTPVATIGRVLGVAIEKLNTLHELSETLRVYIYGFVTTDSRDAEAARRLSEFEKVTARLSQINTRFKQWVGQLGALLEPAIAQDSTAQAHAFLLREIATQARYLMGGAEESLAAELTLSGGNAWGKLQGTLTSQLTVEFILDDEVKHLPMPALINLQTHPDEAVRRRAHTAEIQAWESVRSALAACLNGVKGEVVTLNRRRGYPDALASALEQARIDRATLEAMLAAMADAFPMFRRYFRAKAQRLGKTQLAWWDLAAPTAQSTRTFTFDEARTFILDNFRGFAPELHALAARAFDEHWIDAEQRPGKRGGAFCDGVPLFKESRILCNFDGSLDQVSTIAHELGHAFHNECLFAAGKTELQSVLPMTLAETASIMCETIAMDAALAQASNPQDELAILETSLIGSSQVIVDIYSRFLFEREVFERRALVEVSAEELCEIMARAQRETYGDGLDERFLHPYMWTWKPHYYDPKNSFYNFPYAFGLLFATGLYAIYQERGESFVPAYRALLASAGEASAADLAARFGIEIRTRAFWDASLAIIGQRVDRYCMLDATQEA